MQIVEIGPNTNPIYHYSERVEELLKCGHSYMGVDLRLPELKRINDDGFGYGVQGNLGKIPLLDSTADEIWVNNLLGGDLQNKPETHSDGSIMYTLGFGKYFDEMSRILRPNGTIYIGEWFPRLRQLEWLPEEDFTSHGLSKRVFQGEALRNFVDQHRFNFGRIYKDTPPFFLELKKINPNGKISRG